MNKPYPNPLRIHIFANIKFDVTGRLGLFGLVYKHVSFITGTYVFQIMWALCSYRPELQSFFVEHIKVLEDER